MQRMLQFAGRGLRAGPVPSAARSTSHAQVVRGFRSSAWVGKGIDDFLEKPAEDGSKVTTGRAWLAADLRRKSFEDLHKLWYVLYKERNLVLSLRERTRAADRAQPVGDMNRYKNVKKGMAGIKLVLAERRALEAKPDVIEENEAL